MVIGTNLISRDEGRCISSSLSSLSGITMNFQGKVESLHIAMYQGIGFATWYPSIGMREDEEDRPKQAWRES